MIDGERAELVPFKTTAKERGLFLYIPSTLEPVLSFPASLHSCSIISSRQETIPRDLIQAVKPNISSGQTYMYFFSFGYLHGLINYKDNKTKYKISSLLVFNWVYRLEIHSVMLVFSTQLQYCPSHLLSDSPTPLSKVKLQNNTDNVRLGGAGGVELCWRPYSAGSFNTLFPIRFRTYKIATPPQTKT